MSNNTAIKSSMGSGVEDPGIPLVNTEQLGHNSLYGSGVTVQRKRRKFENVGCRLARRKQLFNWRKLLADLCLAFAAVGILLMIVDTELCIAGVFDKSSSGSILTKSCVTLSTCLLLLLLAWYHVIDAKVFMIDNSMEDWRLAANLKRVGQLLLELAVCAVHAPPGRHDLVLLLPPQKKKLHYDNGVKHSLVQQPEIPTDVLLSLPMFLRLYLLCRVIMLHSRLFQDASSQSIGALNRVPFNFRFIFKSFMSLYPEYVLTTLSLALFLLASWATRACDMYYGEEHRNFLNSMWLTAVTFLTVGYGDIVPISYCGRAIAVLTGIVGTGVTALVVAVLARRLELSRSEKYVHNFVMDIELDKRVRHAAANIVKHGWLTHKSRERRDTGSVLQHQRQLLHSVHRMRQLRNDQRRLVDGKISLLEMHKSQGYLTTAVEKLRQQALGIERTLGCMEGKLDSIINHQQQQQQQQQQQPQQQQQT